MIRIAGNYRERRTWKTSSLTLLLRPGPQNRTRFAKVYSNRTKVSFFGQPSHGKPHYKSPAVSPVSQNRLQLFSFRSSHSSGVRVQPDAPLRLVSPRPKAAEVSPHRPRRWFGFPAPAGTSHDTMQQIARLHHDFGRAVSSITGTVFRLIAGYLGWMGSIPIIKVRTI
jgi:hypothetical protein